MGFAFESDLSAYTPLLPYYIYSLLFINFQSLNVLYSNISVQMAALAIRFGLLLILGSLSSPQAISHPKLHESVLVDLHEQWMSKHRRNYANDTEKTMHFEIFKDNVKYVNNFNKYGNQRYKLGINRFADLANEEVVSDYTIDILKSTDWASTTAEITFYVRRCNYCPS